jgi:hypothetical protein
MAWSWKTLKDSALDALLKPNMKDLEDELKRSTKYLPTQAVIRTTDGTVTTLYAAVIPVNHSVLVEGFVAARRTGGSSGSTNDGAGYRVEFVAKNTSGTATVIGEDVTAIGESQAGWDVTVSASAGTVLVRVTGAADNNVVWNWNGRSLSATE